MKLSYITMMVRDLEQSLAFYEKLVGLKVLRRFNPGPGEIAFLGNGEGETMLELIHFDGAPTVKAAELVMSYQAEGELEALRRRAIDLGYAPTELIHHPTKPLHFRVTDPDGLVVEFS